MKLGQSKIPKEKDGLLRCWHCGIYKPPEEFGIDRSDKYGRCDICKTCGSEYVAPYQRYYYQQHRDELLPKHRESAKASYQRKLQSRKTIPKGGG